VDHIPRPISKDRALGLQRFNELSNRQASFLDDHLYVSTAFARGHTVCRSFPREIGREKA
jgi:hypothetical protein